MSESRDRLSTADVVAAGERAARNEGREGGTGVLAPPDARDLKAHWDHIQASFVDEPRRSVEEADGLVAETMQRIAQRFAAEREELERQWTRGDDVSTEDLRVALTRYRAFFDRLLSM
jgi:glutathione S-transferase